MANFGEISRHNLDTCCGSLQLVGHNAIRYTDFSVVCGYRGEQAQNHAFNFGNSQKQFPASKHNKDPAEAFDLVPYHEEFGQLWGGSAQQIAISREHNISRLTVKQIILREYFFLAGVMLTVAQQNGVKLRWGGDWDRDTDHFDNKFNDLGHFEIIGEG